jgi:hypothetical protein
MYDIMFDEIAYLKKKGAPRDKFIEWIKQSYGIQEGQAAMIEQYAVACTEEVKQIDRRAREIISKAKAQYMNNEVKRGLPIPPPPQELRALEKERETILLRWRKKVEDSMQTDFAHFDKKVKEKFVTPTRIQ